MGHSLTRLNTARMRLQDWLLHMVFQGVGGSVIGLILTDGSKIYLPKIQFFFIELSYNLVIIMLVAKLISNVIIVKL